jgi:rhodanese-related sulfurtransferase
MNAKLAASLIACTMAIGISASNATADGNRYYFERFYPSEISPAKTFLDMEAGNTVVIDVRRVREYYAGHPYAADAPAGYKHAYHVPYPHIYVRNEQTPQDFYDYVVEAVAAATGLDPVEDTEEFFATPVATLCRTGARSVRAANILVALYDPQQTVWDPEVDGVPFTNVRNIWEGFVGRYKEAELLDPGYAVLGGVGKNDMTGKGKWGNPRAYLDLNGDGELNGDVADVIAETRDKSPDKDGWRNYQELPWITMPDDVDNQDDYLYPPADYSGPFTPVP